MLFNKEYLWKVNNKEAADNLLEFTKSCYNERLVPVLPLGISHDIHFPQLSQIWLYIPNQFKKDYEAFNKKGFYNNANVVFKNIRKRTFNNLKSDNANQDLFWNFLKEIDKRGFPIPTYEGDLSTTAKTIAFDMKRFQYKAHLSQIVSTLSGFVNEVNFDYILQNIKDLGNLKKLVHICNPLFYIAEWMNGVKVEYSGSFHFDKEKLYLTNVNLRLDKSPEKPDEFFSNPNLSWSFKSLEKRLNLSGSGHKASIKNAVLFIKNSNREFNISSFGEHIRPPTNVLLIEPLLPVDRNFTIYNPQQEDQKSEEFILDQIAEWLVLSE